MTAGTDTAPGDASAVEDLEDAAVRAGALVDPELLAAIQRVAHRQYLLGPDATAPEQSPRHPLTRPGRRRPSTARATRTVRGTTARKVTWSR